MSLLEIDGGIKGYSNRESYARDPRKASFREMHFLVCNLCFWCATSWMNLDELHIIECPSCGSESIFESMPEFDSDISKMT